MQELKERWNQAERNPVKVNRKAVVIIMVVALVLVMAAPTFAQTTTLDLDTDALQNGLFTGANVIIGALATIMFLLAGFRFGGTILRLIVDTVTNFRF